LLLKTIQLFHPTARNLLAILPLLSNARSEETKNASSSFAQRKHCAFLKFSDVPNLNIIRQNHDGLLRASASSLIGNALFHKEKAPLLLTICLAGRVRNARRLPKNYPKNDKKLTTKNEKVKTI